MENSPIRLMQSAVDAAYRIQKEIVAYTDMPLRIYLSGKGCDGFLYGVTFDPKGETDHCFDQDGLEIIIDKESMEFLTGSVVEYADDDRGKGFVVHNPAHSNYRGKFFKKKKKEAAATTTAH